MSRRLPPVRPALPAERGWSICSRMKRFARLQTLAAGFLLTEVVVGYAGWFTRRREVFPFSPWMMFALVPNRLTAYDLLLHGPADRPQEPPRPFDQSGALVHAPHSVVSYHLIQQFGGALEAGDRAGADHFRRQVEEQFALAHMRYDLVQVTYLPVPRWESGQVLSRRFVRSFVATEPPLSNPDQPPPLERDSDDPTSAGPTPVQP